MSSTVDVSVIIVSCNTCSLLGECLAGEMDFELRLHNEGLKRILIAEPQIVHCEGKNVRYDSHAVSTFSVVCQQISLVMYAKKNFGKKYAFLSRAVILLDWLSPFVFGEIIKKGTDAE